MITGLYGVSGGQRGNWGGQRRILGGQLGNLERSGESEAVRETARRGEVERKVMEGRAG